MICFAILLVLWICLAPSGKGSGYDQLFNYNLKDGKRVYANYYTDTTSAMLIAVLLFCLPDEKPDFLCFRGRNKSQPPKKCGSLVDWPTMQAKFPWSVVLLLGGGFALAEGVKRSGLSDLIGAQLHLFGNLPLVLIQIVCILLTMCITSVTSNTVTASILIPIVNGLAVNIGTNPLALIFPTVFASSFAFTLPIATPPNAIVFSYGMLHVVDMLKVGLLVSLVCMIILIAFLNSYCLLIFNLHSVPDWAILARNSTGTIVAPIVNATI